MTLRESLMFHEKRAGFFVTKTQGTRRAVNGGLAAFCALLEAKEFAKGFTDGGAVGFPFDCSQGIWEDAPVLAVGEDEEELG